MDEKDEAMVLTPGGPRPRSKARRVASDEVVSRGQGTTRVVRAAAYGRVAAELARSQGLVLTPGGFRHPSRVHRLERHEGIVRSGEVSRKLDLRTKGTSDFPAPLLAPTPGVGNGWITDALSNLVAGSTTFTYFKTTWKVPAGPTSQDGQTIFIFNALEQAGATDILQPVLQWGPSSAGGDDTSWTVACWYIDPSGNAYYHDPIAVSGGESLVGVMNMTAQSNGKFNYDCFFEGIDGTNLTVQGIAPRAQANETLECYSMDTCSDYPQAYFVAMTDIQLDVDGIAIQPAWIAQTLVPNCGAHTNIVSTAATGGEVDLFFHGQAPGWKLQQLTAGIARTAGPQAVTNAFASVFGQQQHLAYRDVTGQIWDSWYDGPSNSWNLQRINGVGGNTAGPDAVTGPFVSVFNDQQHFTYTDDGGGIWDAWYSSGSGWNFQGINLSGGTTTGPAAAGDVFVSVYGQQQHFVYTHSDGKIWDAWYDGSSNNWNLQQINLGGSGRTGGPEAAHTPFVSVFGQQQHFAYVDYSGLLWDAWYDGITNNWNLQQINGGGRTGGPAVGTPLLNVSVYGQQQHFAYVDEVGGLWDAWYDALSKNWNLQRINLGGGGRTAGPHAVGEICVSVLGLQQHFAYPDGEGGIWDSWYDGPSNSWNLQEINQGGRTGGPATSSNVFVWVFNSQQHFTYLTATGALWDAWYDSGNNSWNLQQINAGGLTDGPPAAADPFASVFDQQAHVGYRDANGLIWDTWYDGPSNHWSLQQINASGKTSGNPAAGRPALSVFGRQQHFVYRDFNDTIWDSWYDAATNHWNLQQINHGGRTGGDNAVADAVVSVFGLQQHFAYIGEQGTIWDAWYDSGSNSWSLQALNNAGSVPGARTKGPAAQGGPSTSVFGSQQHFAYLDGAGTVWDAWYDGGDNAWNLQAINNSGAVAGGRTSGPPAQGTPFACGFGKQQHFSYRDAGGTIWDSFYDSGSNSWSLLQITGPSGSVNGPPAVSGPFICAFGDQLHFVYVDSAQVVWDAFGDLDTNTWTLQQINLGGFANGGLTPGPAAVSCPFVWVYDDQQHFTYRDEQGVVWDAWYEG